MSQPSALESTGAMAKISTAPVLTLEFPSGEEVAIRMDGTGRFSMDLRYFGAPPDINIRTAINALHCGALSTSTIVHLLTESAAKSRSTGEWVRKFTRLYPIHVHIWRKQQLRGWEAAPYIDFEFALSGQKACEVRPEYHEVCQDMLDTWLENEVTIGNIFNWSDKASFEDRVFFAALHASIARDLIAIGAASGFQIPEGHAFRMVDPLALAWTLPKGSMYRQGQDFDMSSLV